MFTWEDCGDIIARNALEEFCRNAEQTSIYHALKTKLQEQHSTVFKHVLNTQLGWYDPKLNGNKSIQELQDTEIVVSVANEADQQRPVYSDDSQIKILLNDFPYDIASEITHFVVWYRGTVPVTDDKGDISDETRNQMYQYVRRTFVEGGQIPETEVLWFRNWLAIQSIKGINHIHVLVRGLTETQVSDILETTSSK